MDPDGMGPSPWDKLIAKAKGYVVQKAKEAAYSIAKAAIDYIKQKVSEYEPSIYAKLEVKATGEVGGSAKVKGVGVKGNVKGQEIVKLSAGGEMSAGTGKITNTSEASYYNKDGVTKETKGGGADYVAGAGYETETTMKHGQTTNVKTTGDVSVAAPLLGGLQTSVSTDNGQLSSVKAGYVNSVNIGLFLNFSVTFDLGIQIKKKENEQ